MSRKLELFMDPGSITNSGKSFVFCNPHKGAISMGIRVHAEILLLKHPAEKTESKVLSRCIAALLLTDVLP